MKNNGLILGLIAAAITLAGNPAAAQTCGVSNLPTRPIYNGPDVDGMTMTNDVGWVSPIGTVRNGLHNHFTPNRLYTYSNKGIRAGLTHQWNRQEAAVRPWHAGYQYWRYGQPTALVVPPTAAYQTSYGWGVGQTRMTPIHHQFGNATAGQTGGGPFAPTPYWPSHTDQMGVYSVRAPW